MDVKDSVAGIAKVREDDSAEDKTDSEEADSEDIVQEEEENQDL